jgi:hypothetical protein
MTLGTFETATLLFVADKRDDSARAAVGKEYGKDHTAHKTTLATWWTVLFTISTVVVAGVAAHTRLIVVAIAVVGRFTSIVLWGRITVGIAAATSVVIVAHSWLQVGVARGAGTASAARSTAAVGVTATLQVGALRRGVGQRFNLIVLGISALVVLPGVVGEVHAAQL